MEQKVPESTIMPTDLFSFPGQQMLQLCHSWLSFRNAQGVLFFFFFVFVLGAVTRESNLFRHQTLWQHASLFAL